MPIGKKLAVVLSVVVAGTSVAFFFRKDASPFKFWQQGSDDPFGQHVERRVTPEGPWAGRGSSDNPAAQRVSAATTASISQPKGLAPDSQPTFRQNLNPVGALLPPIEGVLGDEDEQDDLDASEALNSERPFAPQGDPSRHVVADGDTLTNLAVRYLGRAEAYLEIFESNRDVLASPDLLPIGAVLKIPLRHDAIGAPLAGRAFEPASPLKMAPVPQQRLAAP